MGQRHTRGPLHRRQDAPALHVPRPAAHALDVALRARRQPERPDGERAARRLCHDDGLHRSRRAPVATKTARGAVRVADDLAGADRVRARRSLARAYARVEQEGRGRGGRGRRALCEPPDFPWKIRSIPIGVARFRSRGELRFAAPPPSSSPSRRSRPRYARSAPMGRGLAARGVVLCDGAAVLLIFPPRALCRTPYGSPQRTTGRPARCPGGCLDRVEG